MDKDVYEKLMTVVPMGGVLDGLIAQLRNAVTDATNQAENGSQLGMATAVGRISYLTDELTNAWLVIKNNV